MNIQHVIHIHKQDRWGWFYVPALILFLAFLVSILISLIITSNDEIYSGSISSIFVYIFVMGILVIAQTYPFAIGMSVTRKDYFFGTLLMAVTVNIIIGALLSLFAYLESYTNGWGINLHFFHFPYVNDGHFFEQLFMYVILLTFLFFSGFLMSSYFYRFGGKGVLILAVVVLLAGSITSFLLTHLQMWQDLFLWFSSKPAVVLSYWLLPFILLSLILSFWMLRKTPV
ncbi:hypothetical protein ACFSCZ_08960 [Siminovitchia sediminis]|uniref:ABC transporter permease n=1 Tax=Siminovitchia sediminis TaxID=1274353 RepID=A0ABW4KG05_9BACI